MGDMSSQGGAIRIQVSYMWTGVITGRQCPAQLDSLIFKVLHLTILLATIGAQTFVCISQKIYFIICLL